MRRPSFLVLVCALSFVSGAAALLYEICWFRSLSLVLGGTQLAVTTTVSVFMLGLALGNWLAARHLKRFRNLLLFYGSLELGIALFAGVFLLLMEVYPRIYIHLAGIAPESFIYLTGIRVVFATAAMIVPTTLMGATLPVLTSFLSGNINSVAGNVSFLYGFNTLGAVTGALITGFLLLRIFPVSAVMLIAASANVMVGLISLALQAEYSSPAEPVAASESEREDWGERYGRTEPYASEHLGLPLASRLVLWGIGISGFCALGYEVLWTRILILFFDATVYSFTLILVTFLLGIGLGSSSYGIFRKFTGGKRTGNYSSLSSAAIGFGVTQVLIGAVTILTMRFLLDLPAYSIFVRHSLYKITGKLFFSRQFGTFLLSFVFMVVPAFFMGFSIPLASRVYAGWKKTTGQAVGELLTYNTVGAIFGAAVSGYVLLYFIGIERSLQVLYLINICTGLIVIASVWNLKRVIAMIGLIFASLLIFLFLDDKTFKSWDTRYLATYTPDRAFLYKDEAAARQQLDAHEVLYYAEGFESIVSSTLRRDTNTLQFSVNGRPEASTNLEDVQNQYMLGHLPMLLHKAPKKALVIGAGSGMTLAAVFSHPGVDELHLVEIEPKVLGVARTFGEFNHRIVDHPDLEIFFTDARNYLLASSEMFDVITADPIHPTWKGSGYLYTSEYFRLAAERLAPGGIMCQWLPLYLLSRENVQSIVRTFHQNFRYVMIWLTMSDVQLVGSNEEIIIDLKDMERRIREPAVLEDLAAVFMGSAEDLFGYFLMGNRGAAAFSAHAEVNEDDNVYLEFSSPITIGVSALESDNLKALHAYRESIASYVKPHDGGSARSNGEGIFDEIDALSEVADRAQIFYLSPEKDEATFRRLREELDRLKPGGRMQSLRVGLFGYEEPGK